MVWAGVLIFWFILDMSLLSPNLKIFESIETYFYSHLNMFRNSFNRMIYLNNLYIHRISGKILKYSISH